jgi:hypothetical protein
MNRATVLRAAACLYTVAMLSLSRPANAAQSSGCPNIVHCPASCTNATFKCLVSMPIDCAGAFGYLCGSGGASCGGGVSLICVYGAVS